MDKQKALITGITGFVGQWLTRHLIDNGYNVIGIDQEPDCPFNNINYRQLDILDTEKITDLLLTEKPQTLYHLAAISFVPEADHSPQHALDINIMGTVSVLDAVKRSGVDTRVLQVGSSKEYDNTCNHENLDESVKPEPTNFYGISKYASELIGLQYVRRFGIDVRFTRSFNHTGPGQSPRFVCSEWAKRVAEIALDIIPPEISAGNTKSVIDFMDVRDVVHAYNLIMEKGKTGQIYNVCSNKGTQLDWILKYLIKKTNKAVKVEYNNSFHTDKKGTILTGNNQKLKSHTGWKNFYSLEKTLDDLYDYWLKILS